MAVLFVLAACLSLSIAAPNRGEGTSGLKNVDFLMPEVAPQKKDTYLCYPMKMGQKPEYIVGYQPHANMEIAHHILLYGCVEPGSKLIKDHPSDAPWNCGEMAAANSEYKSAPVCARGSKILYAWAMDAPALTLPEDVGFKVGGDSGINYLVLQVHYKNVDPFLPPANGKDSSGITMSITDEPQPRRAGVYLLGTDGVIPSHSITYMESACPYDYEFEVHPFAFRTHAHTLGQVTAGYRVRDGQWTEIGRKSPQKPQMFYNATTPGLVVRKGDILAARCTMKNDLDTDMRIGSTQNDEMCNFYMMYYTDDNDKTMETYCFTQGPPNYYWASDRYLKDSVGNIPVTASVIPGTDKVLKQTAEPGLYETPAKTPDYGMPTDIPDEYEELYEVKGADMNIDPEMLQPDELELLIQYLKSRGPRADDDYYY